MNSRVVYGVVEVKDPYNRSGDTHEQPLRFGRFVQLSIAGKSAQNLYRLPRYVVNQDNKVWTVDADRRLQLKTVNIVRAEANQVYVDSGLNSGDKVGFNPARQCAAKHESTFAGRPTATATRNSSRQKS